MREILFRGWRMYYGGWVYGSLIYDKDKTWSFIIDECGTQHPIETASVGQYTELKDKNGVKIFEGDIVTVSLMTDKEKMLTIWSDEYYGFRFQDQYEGEWYITNTDIRVIGNFHDNPELLEVQDDK